MNDEKKVTIHQTVRGCARCSQDHENLEFYFFQNPIHVTETITFPFWAPCPTTGEPIVLRIEKTP